MRSLLWYFTPGFSTGRMRPLSSPAALQAAVDRLAGLRETAGPHVDIGADFHGRLTFPDAKRLAGMLEPHQPMFIEEPVLPGDTNALRAIADSTTIPIAAKRCPNCTSDLAVARA